MPDIHTILDAANNTVYPVTTTSAVYDANGTALETRLQSDETKLIESASATTLPAGSDATAQVVSNELQLGIPRGADAANPFKGWYDSTSALNTAYPSPSVGDYAYVADASPATTVSIYECASSGGGVD